ncbi:NAD-dependent succinate-semialdehyde dehydrogenase [Sessilibacter sp. MAH4]
MRIELDNSDVLVTGLWINNQAENRSDVFAVLDPYAKSIVQHVADASGDDAVRAVELSSQAFASWKTCFVRERAEILRRWASVILEHQYDLAKILTLESGKVVTEALGEIQHSASMLNWYAESALRMTGEILPSHSNDLRAHTIKQPLGVVACITPWNFPAAAMIVKAGAAIAAGNTCVVKPSDETPLIALALARLATVAGLPANVLNVLPCKSPQAVGEVLCKSDAVRMISFTGSIATGKRLYEQCASTLKRVAFELGGNAPFIVFDDADLERATNAAMNARFYNGGQICVGANRFFVQKNVYAAFIEKLHAKITQLTVGDPFDESTQLGPLINEVSVTRINHLITDATQKGARVITGGDIIDNKFINPALLVDMTADMNAYQQEIFGPVVCVYTFDSEDEVIQLANDTQAGLAAYVFSQDYGRLTRLSESIDAGAIGANSTALFSQDIPFGGIKQSGIGKEQGIHSLEEFIDTKAICLGL